MTAQSTPSERVRTIGSVVRTEVARLTDELRADPSLWDRPSACSEWTVGDVACHMAESNDRFLQIVSAALDGQPVPEFSPQQRAERQAAVKARGRDAVLAQLVERVNAVFDRLENATPEGLARTVTVPAGTLSMAQVASQRLSEVALHSWDIRSAADPRAGLAPATVPLLLDGVLGSVGRLAGRRVPADRALTYYLDLSGEAGGPVTLTLADGQATARRGAPAHADVTLHLPAEAAIRLFWGRLGLERALADGSVRAEGDRAAALLLNEIFRGV
ncbi:MAG: maleylpyruvate isomerase family mycothiol-dependent enzyme [Chloroflexi bacterium]|nr:maleylpyruvate isomerase family mycothiol-dependent enzyme [Chloroflexota bacterium]